MSMAEAPSDELFALQKEVALELMPALGIQATPQDSARMGSGATTSRRAYDLYCQGEYHLEQWAPKEAIELYRQAAEIDPELALAYRALGIVHFSIDEFDDALLDFSKAAAVNPNDRLAVAATHFLLGDKPAALIEMQKALAEEPQNYYVQLSMGILLEDLDRTEKAIDYYKKAASFAPKRGTFWRYLARAYHKVGQDDRAIEIYKRVFPVLTRESDLAHFELGEILAQKGRWQEALKEFQEALKLNPKLADPHFHIGEALQHAGDRERAIESCNSSPPRLCHSERSAAE